MAGRKPGHFFMYAVEVRQLAAPPIPIAAAVDGNCPGPAKAGGLDEARTFLDDDEVPWTMERARLCDELS